VSYWLEIICVQWIEPNLNTAFNHLWSCDVISRTVVHSTFILLFIQLSFCLNIFIYAADEGDVQIIGRGGNPGQVCHYSLIFLNDDLTLVCSPIVGKDYVVYRDMWDEDTGYSSDQMYCDRM